MFHQDLSFSRNLLSRTDANDRINWALFYQNTMTYGDFDKMFKRKRCSEEEAKILCPGTPYAHNPAFRKGLFNYFVKLTQLSKVYLSMVKQFHHMPSVAELIENDISS